MKVRRSILSVYLWIGLVSGQVVFGLAIAGCILVFERDKNIMNLPWAESLSQTQKAWLPSRIIHLMETKLSDTVPSLHLEMLHEIDLRQSSGHRFLHLVGKESELPD